MSNRTKFQDNWLNKIDCNKNVSEWAVKISKDPYSCFCNICNCIFSSVKGFEKLNQHAKTLKHKGNLFKIKPNQLQLDITITKSTTELATNQSILNQSTNSHKLSTESRMSRQQLQNIVPISLFSTSEAATRAELFFCMEIINSNSPVTSCEGKKELFQVMFPGCVPESFSLSPTKASYLITYALGPYFKDLLLMELQVPNVYFTLQYDETSNLKNKKELQIRVQYWSNTQNLVVNRHLITYFIEKADAFTLLKYLFKALDSHNLSLKKVLALSSDGPNVNKKVFRLFQEKLKNEL